MEFSFSFLGYVNTAPTFYSFFPLSWVIYKSEMKLPGLVGRRVVHYMISFYVIVKYVGLIAGSILHKKGKIIPLFN
jgi:hypothetical protein